MGVILYALTSEKAVSGIERENKITFVVMLNATKKEVREQVEKDYNEKDCFMCVNKVPEEGIVIRKEKLNACEA